MIQNLSKRRRYGSLNDTWANLITFFRTLGQAAVPTFTITVRNFQGNTSTQTLSASPHLYVVGPPQLTFQNIPASSTIILLPGNYQGLYIREREAALTPDGNVWFRWEEDQPARVVPSSYTIGVF